MALSDLAVFDEYAYLSLTETVAQQVDLFNAASQNTLTLTTKANHGDFSDEAMWAAVSGLVIRRDAYGTGAVSAVPLGQTIKTSVKIAAGTPPVDISPGQLKWIQSSPEAAGIAYGEQLAKGTLQDMLNSAIASFVATVGGVAALNYEDLSQGATLDGLNKTAFKMGDMSQNIVAWIMHSNSLKDIYSQALVNSESLFTFGTVNIMQDGFGRPLIQTDSPNLFFTGTGTNYIQCGLVADGLAVEQNNDYTQNTSTTNGEVNILSTVQSEWTYNMGVKGFAWDKTAGGASPTDAEIATGANWTKTASDNKNCAGVMGTTL